MYRMLKYCNGNYEVHLFSDGTKIRLPLNKDDTKYTPLQPESIDVCISKKCSIGCPYCHEGATKFGKTITRKSLEDSKFFEKFISYLHDGTELAIGGGALSEIPRDDLLYFLTTAYSLSCIPNLTINAAELLNKDFRNFILEYGNYIFAIGISYNPMLKRTILNFKKDFLKKFRNTKTIIIHTIAGVTTLEDYKWLAENNFKVLILGYKDFRFGTTYKITHQKEIAEKVQALSDHFDELRQIKSLSFDTLATQQLDVKNKISAEDWEKYYMGDDGQFTMYIDLVNNTFSPNSTFPEEKRQKVKKWSAPNKTFKIIQTMH